jgi:hypothetical protein
MAEHYTKTFVIPFSRKDDIEKSIKGIAWETKDAHLAFKLEVRFDNARRYSSNSNNYFNNQNLLILDFKGSLEEAIECWEKMKVRVDIIPNILKGIFYSTNELFYESQIIETLEFENEETFSTLKENYIEKINEMTC